jgi:PmbA protein
MREPIEIAEEVVKGLKTEFDDVTAIVNSRDESMVKIWNTEPSIVQSWVETSVTVYIAKNKRTLILSLSLSDPEEIVKTVKSAGPALARLEASDIYAPLPEPTEWKPIEGLTDKAVVEALDNPREAAEAMIHTALDRGVDRVAGTLALTHGKRAVATSKGFSGEEDMTSVEAYLRAFKGEMSGHWAYGSRYLDLKSLEDVGAKAGYYATLTDRKVDYTPGKYDIIISPLVVGNLINYVGFMASAAAVLMGYSMFMKHKVGDEVASSIVSIYDVPRDRELPSSTAFDDEGVPTYDKPIIEEGILRNLLHNSGTAAKMGSRSTGNAGLIFPTPWNLKLSTGSLDEDNLASELENGIIINNNWYTRLQNYVEGVFSTVSRDATLLVKNGEIVGDLGRVRISDKLGNLLRNAAALGRTLYKIKWWEVETPTKAPYMLIKDVNITKPFA